MTRNVYAYGTVSLVDSFHVNMLTNIYTNIYILHFHKEYFGRYSRYVFINFGLYSQNWFIT